MKNVLRTPDQRFAGLPDLSHVSRPPPIEIADGGHFVQEWGEPIAEAAVAVF